MSITQDNLPSNLPKLIAIVGPTASGKTAWGTALCQEYNGSIISCDAKQVYRGMDIGTAKEKELPVEQYLIDIKEPGEKITVAEYQQLAYSVIDKLIDQGKTPFLVGGSMLYAEAVTEGYLFSGARKTARQPRYQTLKIGIQIDRDRLRRQVAERTDMWLRQGLLAEITTLLDQGVSPVWLDWCGQEYRYFTRYLLGQLTLTEATNQTNTSINQYIKRQYTWWRRHPDMRWLASLEEAVNEVGNFLRLTL